MHKVAFAAAMLLAASEARAQVCHTMTADDHADITASAGVETSVAQISMGDYVGFAPSVSIAWKRLEARAIAPYYHLEYRGVKSNGPGDAVASLSGAILDGERVRAGVAMSMTAATGDAQVGLGMGQSMYMPGAWASWTGGAWSALASASYGWMEAGPGGHHHMTSVGSLVSPMNHEELEGAVRASFRATDTLGVYGAASLASPIGEGTTRAFAATGARVDVGKTAISLEAALPIAGDPFHGRIALGVSRTF